MQWCVDAATVSQTKSDTMCAADGIYLDTSDALRAVLILERERGERRERENNTHTHTLSAKCDSGRS